MHELREQMFSNCKQGRHPNNSIDFPNRFIASTLSKQYLFVNSSFSYSMFNIHEKPNCKLSFVRELRRYLIPNGELGNAFMFGKGLS